MSNIKQINPAIPGALRPIRAEDFQHLWDALNDTLAVGTDDTPRIIYGFDLVNDDELSSGAIAYKGQLYTYEYGDNVITLGTMIYGSTVTGVDMRVFDDGSVYDFAFDKIVTTGYGDIPIGRVSPENLAKWKAPYIPDGYIKRNMIGAEAVDATKLSRDVSNAMLSGSVSRSVNPTFDLWTVLSYSEPLGIWVMPYIIFSGGSTGMQIYFNAPGPGILPMPSRVPFKFRVPATVGHISFRTSPDNAVLDIDVSSGDVIIVGEFIPSHTWPSVGQSYDILSYAVYKL